MGSRSPWRAAVVPSRPKGWDGERRRAAAAAVLPGLVNTPRLQVTQGRYGPKSRTNPEDYLSLGPPMASPTRSHSSKTTLGAAVEAFFADRDLAPATRRGYRATYGSLIQAFGPNVPVGATYAGVKSATTWSPTASASK